MVPDSSVGFAPADWVLFLLTGVFLLATFAWRPGVQHAFSVLAKRARLCIALLFLLSIILRLLLLPHHPVPSPDVFEEFGHLLVADTLLHGRLANPPHALSPFFETIFVVQQPTYSSIFPLGLGLLLALGRLLSGTPWTGVLIASGGFCACCYWMLRAWVTPSWALLGGIFAVIEFGPLCPWTNSYWGGHLTAIGGCFVFGALPRLRMYGRIRDAILLGSGCGMILLTAPFESVLLFPTIALFLVSGAEQWDRPTNLVRVAVFAFAALMPAVLLVLLQNRAVTHNWTTLPLQVSRYQYGVPASLTIEPNPTPHSALTPAQEINYKAQALQHGSSRDSITKFLVRLEYRVRYYRFFLLSPLYLPLIAFFFSLHKGRVRWVAATLTVFVIGTNVLPGFTVQDLAAITCLFVLVSIVGLQQLSRIRLRGVSVGGEICRVLIVLCLADFMTWYVLHLFESPVVYPVLQYETWDSINHENPERRIRVRRQIETIKGNLLVVVRYSPHHAYQNEWVWNEADIDASRVIYARDLGPAEDEKLIRHYSNRKVFLLEPDAPVPQLSEFIEEP